MVSSLGKLSFCQENEEGKAWWRSELATVTPSHVCVRY